MFTTRLCRETSRDVILTCRYSSSCTLNRTIRDTIAQLGLRRRGCRAGAHCRRCGRVTSSDHPTDRAAEGIPVITGNRRSADTNVNNRKSSSSCSFLRRAVVPRSRCLIRVPLQQSRSMLNIQSTNNNNNDLSLYVLNAAGLSKQHAVEHLAADFNGYDVDIAVITETHLCAKHTDNILSVPGYTLYRRDRSIRNKSGRRMKGGGVAVYIRSTLLSTVWKYSCDNPAYELMWVQSGRMIIGALYHPPKPQYDPELLVQYIEACIQELLCVFQTADIVIAGDFNQLSETRVVASTGFTQIVRQPTRGTNVLDLVFVSDPFLYNRVRVISSVVKSDHKAIVAYSESRKVAPANKSTRVRYRKVTPSQHAAFLRHVSEDMLMTSHSWPPPPVR